MIPKTLSHLTERGYDHSEPKRGAHVFNDGSTVIVALNADHGKYLIRTVDEWYVGTQATMAEILEMELEEMMERPDELLVAWHNSDETPKAETIKALAEKYSAGVYANAHQ